MESRAGNGGVVREQTWLSTKRDEKLWKAMIFHILKEKDT